MEAIADERLPGILAASALTLAELTLGAMGAADEAIRARRLRHLLHFEQRIELLDFDRGCSRAYGRICLETIRQGRKARAAGQST